MQRLMDVADDMNQKCQVAFRAPAIVASRTQAFGELVDLSGGALSPDASRENLALGVLQAQVDVMPRGRARILPAVFPVGHCRVIVYPIRDRPPIGAIHGEKLRDPATGRRAE